MVEIAAIENLSLYPLAKLINLKKIFISKALPDIFSAIIPNYSFCLKCKIKLFI